MKKLPSVSLIITTCNWPEALEITLLSLLKQKQMPDEIIIVGYESAMTTGTLIDSLKSGFNTSLIHVLSVTDNWQSATMLNKSVAKSQSEYIIQIDSGTILHPCFIKDHLQFASPMCFVTGKSAFIDKRLSSDILSNKHWQLSAFSGHIKKRLNALHIKSIALFLLRPHLDIARRQGKITAYWRQDFVKVNGYDENINERKSGEAELAARFINNKIGQMNLKFSAIQFQLFRDGAVEESWPEKADMAEKTRLNQVKYCRHGLLDLTEQEDEDAFLRSLQGKISATIITYNEEKNIEKCIKSLTGIVDEIVVVDSYSDDETENICKRYPTTFIKNPFEGHIQQKQYALSQATYQYVLSLDADEHLSRELQSSIRQVKNQLTYQGYSMNRRNFYRGKDINHSGWYPDSRIRLFNKEKARWGGENPHDLVLIDNEDYTFHLQGDLYHDTLNSLEEHKRQTENYAKIAANYKFEHGLHKNTAVLKMLFSPISKFFSMYIIRLGFLDGGFGLRICYEEFKCTYKKYKLLVGMYKNQGKI